MANIADNADPMWSSFNCPNKWRALLTQLFPKCMLFKPHTGDKLQLADVTIEILHTHEDLVDPINGKSSIPSTGFNDSSMVARFSTEGMSMLILGDASDLTAQSMPTYYSDYLKSDIVQLAHHVANELPEVYEAVKAKYVFAPTCPERLTNGNAASDKKYARTMEIVRKYAMREFFSGSADKTVGLAYRDGEIKVVCEPIS